MVGTLQDIVRGSFSLIFVILSVILGIILISKYFKYQQKNFITVGLTWIFLSTSWWWSAFNFIANFFFYSLSNTSYLILSNGFIAPAVVCWLYSFASLKYQKWKNKILMISLIISVPYEIVLIILVFIKPSLVGKEISPNVISRTPLTLSVAIVSIIIAVITGLIFSLNALKSQEKKIQLKGKFLIIAFVFFALGAILDSISWTSLFMIILVRLILITSAITYYLGFFLPDRIADWLIKE